MGIAAPPLSQEILMDVCRFRRCDEDVTAALLDDLLQVVSLLGVRWPPREGRAEHAVALLAAVLTSHRRCNPTHLPFGYSGPVIQSKGWMDRDDLGAVAMQIAGLCCEYGDPDSIAVGTRKAIQQALGVGFLQEKQYDAWRPGMASGSGWRSALSPTPYGIQKARSLAASLAAPRPGEAAPCCQAAPATVPPPSPRPLASMATDTPAPMQPTSPPTPEADPLRAALGRLNEMERSCLQAMGEKGIFDLVAGRLPNQEALSRWAGYPCDTTFKTALSSLVKAGYLDNGRHHGKRGGYFLTVCGMRAFGLLHAP